MKTYRITKADLDENNEYIGSVDLSNFDGNIEADDNLGCVKVKSIFAKSILFGLGSGIESAGGITANYDITAGEGITADYEITAGWEIEAGEGIEAGWSIRAGDGITAGWGILAGGFIKAGNGITAGHHITSSCGISVGDSITAGGGIKADWGINAGLSIKGDWISAQFRIFAGQTFRKIPTREEMQIVCHELRSGTIGFGELVILPKETTTVKIVCQGKEFDISRESAKALKLIN